MATLSITLVVSDAAEGTRLATALNYKYGTAITQAGAKQGIILSLRREVKEIEKQMAEAAASIGEITLT